MGEEMDYSYFDPTEPWDEEPPDPAMDEDLWNEVMHELDEEEAADDAMRAADDARWTDEMIRELDEEVAELDGSDS